MAENSQHQRAVQRLVNSLIKRGCPPRAISISGIQNPDLERWAGKKGVIFAGGQKVDILYPPGFVP